MRDPVATSNSDDINLRDLLADVTGVSEAEDTTEAFWVSGIQNVNIHDSSSDVAASDSNIRTSKQAVLTEGQDLPTTMEPVDSEPTNKELMIGIWNIQSGRSTTLETALRALG